MGLGRLLGLAARRAVAAGLLSAAGLALAGCAADPVPRDLTLGPHRMHLRVPAGWEVLERGDQILLRCEASQLAIQDRGPAGTAGVRREVELARELWREGRSREARLRMRAAVVPVHVFRTAGERTEFWNAWARITGADEDAEFITVKAAFADVLARLEALEPYRLDELVESTLAEMDPERRDDVMQRRAISVGGREGVVADTWDRVSHGRERRFALVLDDGYLLLLRTDWGDPRLTRPALDQVLGSLEFRSIEPTMVGRPTVPVPRH